MVQHLHLCIIFGSFWVVFCKYLLAGSKFDKKIKFLERNDLKTNFVLISSGDFTLFGKRLNMFIGLIFDMIEVGPQAQQAVVGTTSVLQK